MHHLSVTNEFLEGRNNLYLFDADETVLVDAGYDTPAIRKQVSEGFDAAGCSIADLDRILLTHYHIDHCGLLEWLVEQSGASVHAHPADIPLIEGSEQAWETVRETRYRLLEQWGVPDEATAELREALIEDPAIYGTVSVDPLDGGDVIDIGTATLRAMHTPGHALGHLAYELPDTNEVLSGDALLPVYTPNVGGADVRVEEPLTAYIRTLRRLAAGTFDRAWPGHRQPIDNPTARANAIITHHEERSFRVLQALSDLGWATIWEVSQDLFGELSGVHILHGPGETYAHIDHLSRTGALRQDGGQYALTDDTADQLSAHSGSSWPITV